MLQTRRGEIAGARNDASCVSVSLTESHYVDFRVDIFRGIRFDFEFLGPYPVNELLDTCLNLGAIVRLLKFLKNLLRNLLLCIGMRFEAELLLFLGSLDEIVGNAVRLETDQDPNLVAVL